MTDTACTPTPRELEEAARPYAHIDAIADPLRRGEEAQQALLAMIAPAGRLGAQHLVGVTEQAAEEHAERFAEEQWRVTVRLFPGIAPAILAVHDHVRETSDSERRCSCPAGDASGGTLPAV